MVDRVKGVEKVTDNPFLNLYNFDVEKMLSILSSKSIILSGSILSNYFMILVMAVVVFVAACTITYIRTKNKKNISRINKKE